jgi:hypothetical protein
MVTTFSADMRRLLSVAVCPVALTWHFKARVVSAAAVYQPVALSGCMALALAGRSEAMEGSLTSGPVGGTTVQVILWAAVLPETSVENCTR